MGNSNLQSKKYYKNVKYRLFLPPYMSNYLHVCSNGHHLKHSTEKEKKISCLTEVNHVAPLPN